jgi:hypothetical protein
MNNIMQTRSFACTPQGSIAVGTRRLHRFFVLLAALCALVAIYAFSSGRLISGILALAVAGLVIITLRMSSELDPELLTLERERLIVRLKRHRLDLPLGGATARRLTPDEIEHLEQLASRAGIVVATGGYDSRLLGEFELYASALENAILIELEEKRLVVTPDDPVGFLSAFEQAAHPAPAQGLGA